MIGKLQHYLTLMRRRAAEGHCSSPRQLLELIYLRFANGILASRYYSFGLYRSTIPWSEKKDFLMGSSYLRKLALFNDTAYNFAVINKVVTNGLLKSFDVPTPPFYGLLNRVDGQTFDGKPLQTVDEVGELVRRIPLDELCFKPVGGWGGKGFLKVRLKRGEQVMVSLHNENAFITLQDFWTTRLYANGGPSYLCQGVIEQHPEVARIHPESINTARVWMCQPKRGEWRMYDAALRMGVGSMVVDNTSSGGIVSRIDITTGQLGQALDTTAERVAHDSHPTTGARVAGRILPMWDDAVALCMRTCKAFPFFRLLGFDVAFGKDAPLIIEVESSPGADHQVAFDHGVGALMRELAAAGPLDWRR